MAADVIQMTPVLTKSSLQATLYYNLLYVVPLQATHYIFFRGWGGYSPIKLHRYVQHQSVWFLYVFWSEMGHEF